jgi:hypothetical protein
LASTHSNERVRCAALRCLGHMAATRLAGWEAEAAAVRSGGGGGGPPCKQVAALVSLIAAGAGPERPSDTREAAAAALASSNLLTCLPPVRAVQVCRIQLTYSSKAPGFNL